MSLNRLFSEQYLQGFEDGEASSLVTRRNRHVGNLLTADRAVFYVQILYRMLLYRRSHELEPLYEDIYDAVKAAQARVGDDGDYSQDQFRTDMGQIHEWGLVTSRIEMERLRGYRDTRRRKFRYHLTEDSVTFIEWLEERLQDELERPDSDTRDLLEEVRGTLETLLQLLKRFQTKRGREDDARRILFHLVRLDQLSLTINADLSDFNVRLLGFVVHHYELSEAKSILDELDRFVNEFLQQINDLRTDIVELVEQLLQASAQEKLRAAVQAIDAERRRAPGLLRRPREARTEERVPTRLRGFYREDGRLDALCRRIHDSAVRVWRKLHSHLRELERRSSRVEDLRERIEDLARLSADWAPHGFMTDLIAAASLRYDPNYWDDHELADPPQPRRRPFRQVTGQAHFLHAKQRRNRGNVVSMERARLERLKDWLEATIGVPYDERLPRVSLGAFTEFDDFVRIMELTRAGLLGEGRRLRTVKYRVEAGNDEEVTVAIDEQSLTFREMSLKRVDDDE